MEYKRDAAYKTLQENKTQRMRLITKWESEMDSSQTTASKKELKLHALSDSGEPLGGRYKCTMEGAVDGIANSDTGLYLSPIFSSHLRPLKMAGRFISTKNFSPPLLIGLAAIEVDDPVHVSAENGVKLSSTPPN